jgi:predicted nucleic acid-binding Zn ribbon protein
LEKKCAVCKKTFTTFDAKKKYCSDACAKKAGKSK